MKEITITIDPSQVPQLVNLICALPNRNAIIQEILNQLAFLRPNLVAKPLSKSKQEWLDQPLGVATDRAIAKSMGVTHQRVQQVRESFGIATFRENKIEEIDWEVQPLGQFYDGYLAKKLGVSEIVVKEKRVELKIPPLGRYDWDNIPLGKLPDGQIAALIGGTTGNVNLVRNKRGIPAFTPRSTINWDEQPLGQVTDTAIAKKLGVTVSCVSQHRYRRNIPVCKTKPGGKKAYIKADWDNLPLGQISDKRIADDIGCSIATVQRRRRERGIPSYGKNRQFA